MKMEKLSQRTRLMAHKFSVTLLSAAVVYALAALTLWRS